MVRHNGVTMPASQTAERPTAPGDSRSWWARFRGWPGWAKATVLVAVGVVLVLVATLVTGWVLVRRALPAYDGEVGLPGLAAEVTVVRDEHGIPQVYADTTEDLMRAQGFVHAQERFWEMDVRRHATAGRLAEMFGPDAVDTDRFVRTLGWRRVAAQELALVRPETRTALEAYADGVNAYLESHSPGEMAVEYTLLGATGLDYRPEPWGPVDSLAWLKAMAWDLRGNMDDEISRALSLSAVGAERVDQLFPRYPYDQHRPIVHQGAVVDGIFEQDATEEGTRLPQRPAYDAGPRAALAELQATVTDVPSLLGDGEGVGSNSWVVDGDHSATGEPLLANDPHLGVSLPGVWMQMGLHCREVTDACPLDVAGFTFSGVPGVVIGHNADIAWGFTNLGPDVTDLYLERVRGDRVRYDGRWEELRTRRETIEVHGGEDVEIVVRRSRHGPLVSDASEDLADVGVSTPVDHPGGWDSGYEVALSWTALDPQPTADAILALDVATDWDSFRAAAAQFAVPAQNLVYADREGHIGYQAPGRVPIRKSGNDGSLPAEGWRADDDWTGEVVPFDGLPSVLDPDEGFVVTANQAVVGPDYPYFLTDDWDRGYRSERIRTLLEEHDELSVDDMAGLQLDDRHPLAPVLVPHLLEQRLPRGYRAAGQRVLADWDFGQDADSAGAAYFNVVWRNLLELTFHDELPEEAWPEGGERWFAVVTDLLEDPDDPWWDDATTEGVLEDRDDILEQALRLGRDELTRLQARNPADWEWGRLHRLDLENQTLGTSGIGLVEWLVNRGPWRIGGGQATVDATGWDAREGYAVTTAPSMRMVVSLADFDESRWVNLTGVSGHAGSDHYTDQTDLWADGETLPWPFSRDAVEAASEDTLTLVPAAEE